MVQEFLATRASDGAAAAACLPHVPTSNAFNTQFCAAAGHAVSAKRSAESRRFAAAATFAERMTAGAFGLRSATGRLESRVGEHSDELHEQCPG